MADSKPAALATAAAVPFPTTAERVRPHATLIGLLALGHFAVDLTQGTLPAVLPFLKSAHGFSYAEVATIVLAANLTASLLQPLFGYLADQTMRRWILPASVVVAGAGMALTGLAPGYTSLVFLVIVMGLGVAAWHPEGYRTATGVGGDRRATAISYFSLGGNVGIALGPLFATFLVTTWSLGGTLAVAVPPLLVGAALFAALPSFTTATTAARATKAAGRGENMPGAMALLILVVMLRAGASLGFTTFMPFYYVDYLQADPSTVGALLFVFLGAGALGTVLIAPLADRWGPRALMKWGLLAAVPFGLLFLATRGTLAIVLLALFGAVLTASFSLSVVLAQAYLPRHTGMASGLIVGFAFGTGGLGVAALGVVADRYGLPVALAASALTPLGAFVAARFLPAPRDK
ncbi:MAG TPA: MFS transporter [Methylomirabilota bacterium]|jgi:FSR family fosmidomycin resistance protein-like MFS transporter|nr:MFS transporter [Methylomirabilota bacterium]